VYKLNIEASSRSHCSRAKAISVEYDECVSVAVVIWKAERMRHIILSSVSCLGLQYFFRLSHKGHDFGKQSYLT
jgi:hypothetical protein